MNETEAERNLTLREAFNDYRNKISILKKGYAQEKYRIDQIARSFLGERIVREVKSVDIATYRDLRLAATNPKTGKQLSSSTVRLEMSLLSNFFDICRIEWGLCDNNPCLNVRKPKVPPGRDRRLTPREERQILRYSHNHRNPQLYSIIVFALESGMRQGEILGLQWENLNLKARVAHLPETKNGSKRDVPLSVNAREALIRIGVKTHGRVFDSYVGNGLKATWRLMLQRLHIEDLHFHDLRHEAISRLFELGTLDMMEISAISGHKSLSMLKRYTHLSARKLAKKLEGNKHKGKQVVIDHLIPYPAAINETPYSGVSIRLLDFEDLSVRDSTRSLAIQGAQNLLLRRILGLLRSSTPVPQPDQYLEYVDENFLLMIDPLGGEAA